jgi:hypothetical protein
MRLLKGCFVLRKFFVKEKPSILDESIDRILAEMKTVSPASEQYREMRTNLEGLVRLNKDENSRVSPDTMAIVAGNLLGILIIVMYERNHVMVSKGLGFILKTK